MDGNNARVRQDKWAIGLLRLQAEVVITTDLSKETNNLETLPIKSRVNIDVGHKWTIYHYTL